MLSMLKDKKGFASLFSKPGEGVPAAEASARISAYMGQQRCQRCWKNFAVVSGTPVDEYTCYRCDYPVCRLCREECPRGGRGNWTCCTCAQPITLMRLFGKTRYGTELVAHIMEYCDPRSERILKSFFRAAAVKLASVRQVADGRPSSHCDSARENGTDSARKTGRRSGSGLKVQSPSNTNRRTSGKLDASFRNTAKARPEPKGPAAPANELQTTPARRNEGVYTDEDNDNSPASRMPTIGMKDQFGVVEYSPSCVKEQLRTPRRAPEFASPLSFGGETKDTKSESGSAGWRVAGGMTPASDATPTAQRTPLGRRTSGGSSAAFEREAVAPRSTAGSAASALTPTARMSRTDGPTTAWAAGGAEDVHFGGSPSPARSESPAPRFPSFAQFLDDRETLAVQQQQYATKPKLSTQSGQSISVSPETEDSDRSPYSRNDNVLELTGRRQSTKARRTGGTSSAAGSLTPRATTVTQKSRRSSLEFSSSKKRPIKSLSRRPTAGRSSGSRRRATSGNGSGLATTPPPVPTAHAAHAERLTNTDGGNLTNPRPTRMSAGFPPPLPLGSEAGSSGQRTPLATGRSTGSGFTRCGTATRLSYGSAVERSTQRLGIAQRRPPSNGMKRTPSSNLNTFERQNSRGGARLGRTNSSANHLGRTTPLTGYAHQSTTRSHLAGGGGNGFVRTASAAGRFGRTGSSRKFLTGRARRNSLEHRSGAAMAFVRTRSANAAFARTPSGYTNTVKLTRSATAMPSRLVRTYSTNAAFERSNTKNCLAEDVSGSHHAVSAHGPLTDRSSLLGHYRGQAAGASAGFSRMNSSASPLVGRAPAQRRVGPSASPLTGSSPLKRTNTRRFIAATASERERLVRTPTQTRLERQPTRTRTATPSAGAGARGAPPPPTEAAAAVVSGTVRASKTVEAAPMLVHVTRKRASGAGRTTDDSAAAAGGATKPVSAVPSAAARTTKRTRVGSVSTTRTLHRGSGSTEGSTVGSARPHAESGGASPKNTGRRPHAATSDSGSVKSNESPRPVLRHPHSDSTGAKRRKTPSAAGSHTSSASNSFHRLATPNRKL